MLPKRRLTVFTGVSGSGKSSLVFDTIANGFVNKALQSKAGGTVRVYAYSLDNQPIPGVDVVVKISGNSSTISFFGREGPVVPGVTINPSEVIAKGGPNGYAELTGVTVTKAGGYTLSAQVNVVDVVGANLFNSLSFNIQNK